MTFKPTHSLLKLTKREEQKEEKSSLVWYLHNVGGIPQNSVGVEILVGIKPEIELLLPVPLPLSEHIGM